MLRQTILVVIVALLFFTGCQGNGNDIPAGTLAALQQGDGYELLSLDPRELDEPPPDHFHGWRVLGRTTITDPATRKKLNEALRKGARENTGMAAACFNPRHGIHVVHNGKAYDLVICFECLSVMGFEG